MHFRESKSLCDEWPTSSKLILSNVHLEPTFCLPVVNLMTFSFHDRDEKATLLSQISTLQAQQIALENRLESVSQTADNAMEREREAEDRLDAALSMHARQLTQRQVCKPCFRLLLSCIVSLIRSTLLTHRLEKQNWRER